METTAVRRRLTWQAAAVTSIARETASVVTIGLEPPDWPGHRAGQHLDVRLTAEDGYTAERSYSIPSAPGEPLAITVERLENGEGHRTSPTNCGPETNWSCAARSAGTSCGSPPTTAR